MIFLVAPVVAWSVLWIGATWTHLAAHRANGIELTPQLIAGTFVTHGLVGLLLITFFIASCKGSPGVSGTTHAALS